MTQSKRETHNMTLIKAKEKLSICFSSLIFSIFKLS